VAGPARSDNLRRMSNAAVSSPGAPAGRVLSVSTGRTRPMDGPELGASAIDKQPRPGRVAVGPLGLDGDECADTDNHGGTEQAVYAYAREDLDWWTGQLGRELRDGIFGENITTAGVEVSGALIGETWRLGTAVVQVTAPRIPCNTFKAWLSEPHWVRRFARAGRPGAYLRVLTPGEVGAGDPVRLLHRPEVQVTVAESMRAFYGDAGLMRRLLQVPGRGGMWDEIGAGVLARAGV
jgi:MOSC domain-containing protein YiiM